VAQEENASSIVESKATGRGGRKSVASTRGRGRGSRGKASVAESNTESPVKSKRSVASKKSVAASRRSGRNKVVEEVEESE
jgi:hypothetical protein